MDKKTIESCIKELKDFLTLQGCLPPFNAMVSQSMADFLFPEGFSDYCVNVQDMKFRICGIIEDVRILVKENECKTNDS